MELEELIENTLRRKLLEEMINRLEKEHTPLEGMDNEQIKRFALFLFEEKHNALVECLSLMNTQTYSSSKIALQDSLILFPFICILTMNLWI